MSLVPSQTELLHELGLDNRVVGITKFCVHPAHWRKSKTIVGGTKNFNLEMIDSLQPDLIIANKEENYIEGIEALRKKYPVWISDVNSLTDALSMIAAVGKITEKQKEAAHIIANIQRAFADPFHGNGVRVLYFIWKDPWMGAGSDTFIHDMLCTIGLVNVLSDRSRYPQLDEQTIRQLSPDLVLLSSEPYPFKEKHCKELAELLPGATIKLVDGEMFSWYGSRLVEAAKYFRYLFTR